MPQPNQRLGEYVLIDQIGQGAFGEVWRACHHAWEDQIVAIKIPTEPQYVRNLQREGNAVHRLSHPNIVKAIAFDPFGEPPYFVTEYVPGTSLRAWIQRGPMPQEHAVVVMKQVLDALDHAHKHGLVHRDIKPENILIHMTAEQEGFAHGTVKLADFGLGRVAAQSQKSIMLSQDTSESRRIVGSHQYMAPEQMDGRDVDGRADLYSCGVVFFELLTGHRPAGMEVPSDVNPAVPRELDEVFRRAFARLERRFASAEEFSAALNRAAKSPRLYPPPTLSMEENLASPKMVSAASPSLRPPPVPGAGKQNLVPPKARRAVATPPVPRGGTWKLMLAAAGIAAVIAILLIFRFSQPSGTTAPTTELHRAEPTAQAAAPFTNSIGMKFVSIAPGEFDMGSPPAEAGRKENESLHHVKITKPFLMAATTVTQAQWKSIMGNNPSQFQGNDRPVESIAWNDAVAFCEKLSAKEGRLYRLPTEAEWEYACRAGAQSPLSFGDGSQDDYAWHAGNSQEQTHDVATKTPNRWGLYDMQGNVWQWCSDGYGPYRVDPIEPKGVNDSTPRVLRGGSWSSPIAQCRAACRYGGAPDDPSNAIGFRVCLTAQSDHVSEVASVRTAKPTTIRAATQATTLAVTESTTLPTTKPTTLAAAESTTLPATRPTTLAATESTTLPATRPTTLAATESTTLPATRPTTLAATESTTLPATRPTTLAVTESTTLPATRPTTLAVTESTTLPATRPTTLAVTESTTLPATGPTTLAATKSTTFPATRPATLAATDSMTVPATRPSTTRPASGPALPAADSAKASEADRKRLLELMKNATGSDRSTIELMKDATGSHRSTIDLMKEATKSHQPKEDK